ncbi:MAG: hypothetical protein KJ915_07305 [Candidatus Omnitrophica bacterium]|nr:hypothetical protein [Candidatus Omnitrophota bacterium]
MDKNISEYNRVFKQCPSCEFKWAGRGKFLADPQIKLHGYQADSEDLVAGLFLFTHSDCGTTMAIKAKEFTDLYSGPIFETRKTGSSECPKYCLFKDELRSCSVKCECAYVREVLQIIKNWNKIDKPK